MESRSKSEILPRGLQELVGKKLVRSNGDRIEVTQEGSELVVLVNSQETFRTGDLAYAKSLITYLDDRNQLE